MTFTYFVFLPRSAEHLSELNGGSGPELIVPLGLQFLDGGNLDSVDGRSDKLNSVGRSTVSVEKDSHAVSQQIHSLFESHV